MVGEDGLHGGGEDELHGGGEGEDDKEYFYGDWGVDHVDLDFKTVPELQTLLAERQSKLPDNLYRQSSQVDAQLIKQLKSLSPNPLQFSSTYQPSPSFHISQTTQEYSSSSSTQNTALSSTNSIRKQNSLLSFSLNQSSTIAEEAEENIFGSVKTFPTLPYEENLPADYGNILITIGFLIVFLIIAIFVIIQCSHFAVSVYRAVEKKRMQDRGLPLHARIPIDLVVEVESLNNICHHHMVTTPQSPVSLLQNSPVYSPVKDSPCSPSSSLSLSVFRQSEDRTSQEDKTSPWSPNDKDEGIELEEDIEGSAFKQLILTNAEEEDKNQTWLSNTQNKNHSAGKANHGRQTARGHSEESPSISLCSEVITAKYPPFPPHTRENSGFGDIFGNMERVVNIEECLI